MARHSKRRKPRSRARSPRRAPSPSPPPPSPSPHPDDLDDVLVEIAASFTSARQTLLSFSNESGNDVFDEETRLELLQLAIQMWRDHPDVPELVAALIGLAEERQRHLDAMRVIRMRFLDLEYARVADVHLGSVDRYYPLIRAIQLAEQDPTPACHADPEEPCP